MDSRPGSAEALYVAGFSYGHLVFDHMVENVYHERYLTENDPSTNAEDVLGGTHDTDAEAGTASLRESDSHR